VTREAGATLLHPISSTREIMRSGFHSRYWISRRARALLESPARIVYGDGPAGTALFFNAQLCVHRAGIPQAGLHRDMVQFVIDPSPVPLADDWPSHIEHDPAEVQVLRQRAARGVPVRG